VLYPPFPSALLSLFLPLVTSHAVHCPLCPFPNFPAWSRILASLPVIPVIVGLDELKIFTANTGACLTVLLSLLQLLHLVSFGTPTPLKNLSLVHHTVRLKDLFTAAESAGL